MTKLTTTTGTVKGEQACKDFMRMANQKFSQVIKENSPLPVPNYIQYTLLTDNRILVVL